MAKKYDFSAWVTKYNTPCSDGRTILPNAFAHQDGDNVPLFWQHGHGDTGNVLGNVDLKAMPEGVMGYATLNNTEAGKQAKEIIRHGDVKYMSILAMQLKEAAKQVMHGNIKEASLVISGANPGAVIKDVYLEHSELDGDDVELGAVISTGAEFEILQHSTIDIPATEPVKEKEAIMPGLETLTIQQQEAIAAIMHGQTQTQGGTMLHASDPTVADVFNSMTEDQKNVVYFMIATALEEAGGGTAQQGEFYDGGDVLKHNVFDSNNDDMGPVLTHDQLTEILRDAKTIGSLKESFLKHAADYGFDPIGDLFPEAKLVRPDLDLIKRETTWVGEVLSGVHHTPFARIKTRTADLTADEARAKGYVTGNLKKEQIIKLAKRSTDPTTIYKKQKIDRDDLIDITDFDVVVWLRNEMRMMLDEELARAILIGDGRDAADEDHIPEDHIRPIASDDSNMYVHQIVLEADATVDDSIDAIIENRRFYKGSGSPKMFTNDTFLSSLLTVKDTIGRRIYNSATELNDLLRISGITNVEVMNGATLEASGVTYDIEAIIVNLRDYTVGTNAGGQVGMFEDFDIDYNQHKYLIETRCSGALTKPKSALVILRKQAAG